MTSMTFKVFKLKFSKRSSAEHGFRGGSREIAFLKSTLECSLIYCFLTVFDFVCMSLVEADEAGGLVVRLVPQVTAP